MRKIVALVLLISSVVAPSAAHAQASTSAPFRLNEGIRLDISQLKRDAKAITDDIAVLRRDQINYRVEKDLLKDAYASNLQSINTMIAIVLAVITVLGFFGLKSLNDLKAEYAKELDSAKALKTSFKTSLDGYFNGMIEAYKKILVLKPYDTSTITNYAETLAAANRGPEFEAWYEENKAVIESEYRGGLGVFVKSLKLLMNGDLATAKTVLAPFVDACLAGAAPRLGAWGFEESKLAISTLPESPSKAFAGTLIQFFQGELPKETMQTLLAA